MKNLIIILIAINLFSCKLKQINNNIAYCGEKPDSSFFKDQTVSPYYQVEDSISFSKDRRIDSSFFKDQLRVMIVLKRRYKHSTIYYQVVLSNKNTNKGLYHFRRHHRLRNGDIFYYYNGTKIIYIDDKNIASICECLLKDGFTEFEINESIKKINYFINNDRKKPRDSF